MLARVQGTGSARAPIGRPSLAVCDSPIDVNIQNLGGKLYVTFAKQDKDREDDVSGPGSGSVDVLDPTTNTFTRLISGQPGQVPLDSPWGLAIAPESFGEFSGALLVRNFGNGRIEAFDPSTGARLGQLRTPQRSKRRNSRLAMPSPPGFGGEGLWQRCEARSL